jgi:SAM-dependent methyltransferase
MSEQDRSRWEERYASGAYGERTHPSELLVSWAPRILTARQSSGSGSPPQQPRALDVACGTGRNARYLAGLGFEVDALDIAEAGLVRAQSLAVADSLSVRWLQHDLDSGLPEELSGFDLILLVRYVNLPLLRELGGRLKPGGWLICEEHLQTREEVIGPGNPDFRVAPGALADAAKGLEVLLSEEGLSRDPDGRPVALARLVARRPFGSAG